MHLLLIDDTQVQICQIQRTPRLVGRLLPKLILRHIFPIQMIFLSCCLCFIVQKNFIYLLTFSETLSNDAFNGSFGPPTAKIFLEN